MTNINKTKMTSGIVLYNIELNGCLNGVFTNDALAGVIYNEIAKNRNGKSDGCICGTYDCFYFDAGNELRNDVELKISIPTGQNGIYSFVWSELPENGGQDIFAGIGYKMNHRQIAVHYKLSE